MSADVYGRTGDPDDNAPQTRRERRALRDKVLRVIDYQTSPKQLPGTTAGVIRDILVGDCNRDPEAVGKALRATVEHGQVLRWTRNGGAETRYTVVSGEYADADTLLRLHRYAGEHGARELAGEAYRRYQEVCDDA